MAMSGKGESLSERRASGWTGSGTQRRELHRNLVVLELAQDWKRTEERSKERKEEGGRQGPFSRT